MGTSDLFIANQSDAQVATWTRDWHLKCGENSLVGLSPYPVGSDTTSREIVPELS